MNYLNNFDTSSLEEFLKTKLSSKLWRLSNLYKITNKDGNLQTMVLNRAQNTVLRQFKHNKKIILKSRQQGISTMAVAYNLDSCLFNANYSAGIQSYGVDEARKLKRKAELMWEELDNSLKKILNISLVTNNSSDMTFSNGSILKIGNFRGDTLQSLHVSELAKIAKKYPEKAMELKTGAFQAIAKNSKITIESTAEGKSGLFYDMWQKAVQRKNYVDSTGTELTPFDFEPIFLSWVDDPDCNIDVPIEIPKNIEDYFTKLYKEHGISLTQTQKWWYAAKYEEIGFEIKQEYPTIPSEAFEKSIEGTYYQNEYKTLKYIDYTHDPALLVHSACDLGMNDTFSIGFFQITTNGVVNIIMEYQDSGQGLAYYREIYDALAIKYGWRYGQMYVPHDVRVRELTSAKTRYDVLKELGFRPTLVKKHSLQDGIEATRQFLKTVRINKDCEKIIAAIQGYRKAYNQQLGVFLDKPVHDELSHTADMLRYMAMGIKHRTPEIYSDKPSLSYNLAYDL